jgi:hypothetical protein
MDHENRRLLGKVEQENNGIGQENRRLLGRRTQDFWAGEQKHIGEENSKPLGRRTSCKTLGRRRAEH